MSFFAGASARGEPGRLAVGGPMKGGAVLLGGTVAGMERWRTRVGLIPSASPAGLDFVWASGWGTVTDPEVALLVCKHKITN